MKTIITIGRQFGSGGKEVGIRVAKELGIPFYDKELLQEAAKKSGLCEKICPAGAIKVSENRAFIFADKCLSCGACAMVCPRGVIHDKRGILTHRI